jgi:hypothetical protein
MADDGGGSEFKEYRPAAEDGWSDFSAVLRGTRLGVLSGGAEDHSGICGALGWDGKEAGDDSAVCGDNFAGAYRGRAVEPTASEVARLALTEMGRKTSARRNQALALGWRETKEFINSAGAGLRADREKALLCVAYDTMARRSELVGFDVEDVEFVPNGSGRMLIRRSKTDQTGEGCAAYLSRTTVRWLQQWLEIGHVREGRYSGAWSGGGM